MNKTVIKNPKKSNQIKIRLHIKAGAATPAPPIGPALSQHKLNIPSFCKEFNDKTKTLGGVYVPVDIYVLEGNKYSMKIYNRRVSDLIREELGIEKGSKVPGREEFKTITRAQLLKIAKYKMPDMTAANEDAGVSTIAGTARSMGIRVE